MQMKIEIPIYEEIEDYYEFLGYSIAPCLPDFDIFNFAEVENLSLRFVPPVRKGFYQIVCKRNPAESSVLLNTARIESTAPMLLFQSPHHVYAWRRKDNLQGFVVFFKADFVEDFHRFDNHFPFFRLNENNRLILDNARLAEAESFLFKMLEIKNTDVNFKAEILRSLLNAFLYFCKSAFENLEQTKSRQPKNARLAQKFLELVTNFYIERKQVADYAELLGLTPNHLNEVVKKATGKTARSHIVSRVLIEAENLLAHTDLDVSEISDALGFDEPTNFTKFFKKYSKRTPREFRNKKSAESA